MTYSVHTYSYCSVHHHCTDGEHQQRDGKSNTGILCMTKEAIYYILLYTLKDDKSSDTLLTEKAGNYDSLFQLIQFLTASWEALRLNGSAASCRQRRSETQSEIIKRSAFHILFSLRRSHLCFHKLLFSFTGESMLMRGKPLQQCGAETCFLLICTYYSLAQARHLEH